MSMHRHWFTLLPKKVIVSSSSFSLTFQVCQWITDRVSVNSSPASSSTSSSFHGSSSATDWTTTRRERSSPLRGPHGKFVSPSSVGYGSSSSPPDQATGQRSRGERHTDMAELAKHVSEAELKWSMFQILLNKTGVEQLTFESRTI